MIQNPASSRSISTIVAVAARLMTAFRQKPCQARFMLKNEERDHGSSVLTVVRATDLVADDAALLERPRPACAARSPPRRCGSPSGP